LPPLTRAERRRGTGANAGIQQELCPGQSRNPLPKPAGAGRPDWQPECEALAVGELLSEDFRIERALAPVGRQALSRALLLARFHRQRSQAEKSTLSQPAGSRPTASCR